MKKFRIPIIIMLISCCWLSACQQEDETGITNMSDSNILFSLQTKAVGNNTEIGDDLYNENKVEWVDVYFFLDPMQVWEQAQAHVPVSKNGTLKLKVEESLFNKPCTIYMVANATNHHSNTPKTLAEIQATKIVTEWKNGIISGKEIDTKNNIEQSLIMHGKLENVMLQQNSSTPIEVTLSRAMAKVVMFPSVEKSVMIDGKEYFPDKNAMDVTFAYAVKATQLDGKYKITDKTSYISRMKRTCTDKGHVPFYSYPNPIDTEENVREYSYLILRLPWGVREQGGNLRYNDYYYYVPISNESKTPLTPNKYYKVKVQVGMLGSLDPRQPVQLENVSFEVIDWYTLELDTEIQHYEFLVLEDYTTNLYNTEEFKMPFISSSSIKSAKVKQVKYMNYKETEAKEVILKTESELKNYNASVTWDMDYLTFNHIIDQETFVPHEITIQIENQDGQTVDWIITQYPAIYVTAEQNQNGNRNRFIYGKNTSGDIYNDNRETLGGVNNPWEWGSSSTNKNRNQYTVYITAFDKESKLAIGDPRKQTVDNLQYLSKKTDWKGGKLDNYYPTSNSTEKDNVVAPAFKIASSYGVVNSGSLTYETAQQRCASYQENGYPAGRWRIPTEGEIEYIIGLSDKQKIPKLFGGDYFAASGRYYDNESSKKGFYTDNQKHSVRCIYDVWYWGNDKIQDPTKFTWGDN